MAPLPAGLAAPGVRPEHADDPAHAVRLAQLGSHAAFEQLVLAYGDRLHRFLALRLGRGRDPRDVLQETLIAAWRALPSLEDPAKFWPWLAGIAAHKAADERRRRVHSALDEDTAHASAQGDGLEVREALGRLSGAMREVLLLRYVLNLSEEETAAALGVRVGTVKSRAARARQILLEALA